MKILQIVLFALVIGSCVLEKSANKSNQQFDVHVFLLAGQSNMAGAGNYDALDTALKERIMKAGKQVQLSVDGKPSQPLSFFYSEYQKNKRGFGNVFGPELFLGLTLAENNPTQEFLLIKKAQGGTSIYGAWNAEWTSEKAIESEEKEFKQKLQLYNIHQQQINDQLALLEKAGKTFKIVGMGWMQGENDAAIEKAARSYESNLKKLIAGYRREYNVPNLPFIIGQINSSYGEFSEGPDMVRRAMGNVSEQDEMVALINTSMDRSWLDYPKHSDNVHYNHVGQMRLGIAFANEWKALSN